jgi:hypothetical protein
MKNKLKGGKGDRLTPKDVDNKELRVGKKVEHEHSNDKEKQQEVALDHLAEDPKYYSKLVKSGLVDEKPALKLAKKLLKVSPKNESFYPKLF